MILCKSCKWVSKEEYENRLEEINCYHPQNIIEYNNRMRFLFMRKDCVSCNLYEERTNENKDEFMKTDQFKSGLYI